LSDFSGGRLVVHIVDMPIKCPVAPLEFAFLAEAYSRGRGMRDRVEIVYVTPLPGAFTKPVASARLGSMLDDRKIVVESGFLVERVEPKAKTLVSYDEREIPFDLLVTVPLNMGAEYVARSGLGNELNYAPVDRHTFLSEVTRAPDPGRLEQLDDRLVPSVLEGPTVACLGQEGELLFGEDGDELLGDLGRREPRHRVGQLLLVRIPLEELLQTRY
jgi:hypothetical protein